MELAAIDQLVGVTRTALFVREADDLLMIRPDKTLGINRSAAQILTALYNREQRPAAEVLPPLATRLGISEERLLADTGILMEAVRALLNEDFSPRPGLRFGTFDRSRIEYPTLAEIALTYGCQNRCIFCYASSPFREGEHRLMSTAEVKRVMEVIFHDAHVPSLSFTGGESTLRKDLPELIRHGADLGLRINVITNGARCADLAYARTLVDAGLASAQVSIEAGNAELHDAITQKPGSFARTVAGVRNLQSLGIHVHTNTTLCGPNLDAYGELIRFVATDLGLETQSMNMVIRTGEALDCEPVGVSYSQVAERLPGIIETAAREGVRFVWYSPIPYCIFNPALHDLGAKACACVDGILSVDPAGEVLPCSSFESGIGSLLDSPFKRLFRSRPARYWRRRDYVPPVCAGCTDIDICGGACPLYWDAAGSFAELPVPGSDDPQLYAQWRRGREASETFGVQPGRKGDQ